MNSAVAEIVQRSLLHGDGVEYRLHAWVIMPNHTHSLLTRFEDFVLDEIVRVHKSHTAREVNALLARHGQFWMEDYFDRYVRNGEHFRDTIKYIENNPVKAGLCKRPEDWPFSSAWFRNRAV